MISLNYVDSNANGSVTLEEKTDSTIKDLVARVTRTATLDGGCVITNNGISDSDRSLTVRADISEAVEALLDAMLENETLIHVATPIGYFTAHIRRATTDNGELTLEIYIKEKLSN